MSSRNPGRNIRETWAVLRGKQWIILKANVNSSVYIILLSQENHPRIRSQKNKELRSDGGGGGQRERTEWDLREG